MSQLNLNGLVSTEPERKIEISRNRHRKAISLNSTDKRRPYATTLRYWKEHKLATPIVWAIFDTLGSHESLTASELIKQKTPREYAEYLLETLRESKR
jgi:hypothetical protein